MKILCVIPSRIGSTRLPRKPLLEIQAKPMIQWVYENASRCSILDKVVVATDSSEIASVIKNINGNVVMTEQNLKTGSDRVAHVAEQYPDTDIVINLQGDEPFIKPQMLETLVSPYLAGERPHMTTLAYHLDKEPFYNSSDAVKVIVDKNFDALYFSRSPIPYMRNMPDNEIPAYHHMGLYAFTRDFLLKYTQMEQTPLEKAESLEQLRALENGYKIRVCLTPEKTIDINTQEELQRAQQFIYTE